ncbi:MAG: VWA domain-containing protein [Pseudomonadota bacterium]
MSLDLANAWVLFLLPLPYLVWRFAPPHREQVSALRIPFFRQITSAAGVQGRSGAAVLSRSWLQMLVASLVWGLVILALAKPERLGEPVVIETSARDIILALDVSGSMDERDFESPDGTRQQRLDAVKAVVSEFIATRENDRMALIIFGTRAFVQAPFTEDLASLEGFLGQITVGLAGPDTALGDAIGLSLRTFEASDVQERVLILLSDGADTSSRMSPANAAAIAADRGVTIHTVGVGDPAASGDDKVDLPGLQNIASVTGGAYFFASDQTALEEVYGEIDKLTPRITDSTSFRPKESLAHLPLALAVVLILSTSTFMTFREKQVAQT